MAQQRRLSHPLCGANLTTLARVLAANGGIRSGRLPQAAMALGAALGRLPFSLLERGYVAARRGGLDLEPPIFILGHWRSGTTHLYNVMTRSPAFAFVSPFSTGLPWDFLLMGRALEPLLSRTLPEDRYIDNIPVEADSPQEDEIALANMTALSFYHALYFPERFEEQFDAGIFFDGVPEAEVDGWVRTVRYFYDKLALRQPGRRLLIKNPVYTARVALLRRIWPDAKFVHIHRNPYKVFVSTRNFYDKLFDQFALQPYDHVAVDEVIFRTYARMMDALARDTADMDRPHYVELRFEDFQRDPMGELKGIYDGLELPGFDAAAPDFSAYLDSVRSYRKNSYRFPEDLKGRIGERWRPYIEQWQYSAPA